MLQRNFAALQGLVTQHVYSQLLQNNKTRRNAITANKNTTIENNEDIQK